MKKANIIALTAITMVLAAAGGISTWPAVAQQLNQFSIGNFTVNVPAGNPVVTVQAPARNGTLALREELPASAPQISLVAGSVTLAAGVATITLPAGTPQRCHFYDRSGNTVQATYTSATTVTVRGAGSTVDWFCP